MRYWRLENFVLAYNDPPNVNYTSIESFASPSDFNLSNQI